MQTETVDGTQIAEALAALRREVSRLGERVAALEAATGRSLESGVKSQEPWAAATEPGPSEELILVISAAVAAFLGKRPHIRQIRLVGTTTWAQQGRVTIQASHALSLRHGRSSP